MSVLVMSQEEEIRHLLDTAYASRVNDLDKSSELSAKALDLSQQISNQKLIAESLCKLSLFNMIKGEYQLSTNQGKQALDIYKTLNYRKGIADVKYNIAGVYYKTDNYHLGLIYLIDSLEIYRELDDYHNQSRVLKSLGTIYEYFGDTRSAVNAYEESMKAGKKANDLNLVSNALNPLSGIFLNRGEIEKAEELIEESISMKNETGDIRGLAFAIYGRAKVCVQKGQYEKAEKLFIDSLNIHNEMGERLGSGMVYHKLGALYLQLARYEEAKALLTKAVSFAEEYNIVIIKFKCNQLLYRLYKELGQPQKALDYLEKYLDEKEAVINNQTHKVIESYAAITKMEQLQIEAQLQREKAELLEKKNKAEQASRVKQEFLSTMSHEIRTPLNAVITITSLLYDKYKKDGEELLDSLKFSADNLLRIINDILDFNKLDVGKVKLDFETTSFRPFLQNIINTYNGLAKEKGILLTLNIDDKISENYELDQTKLTQILGNLLSNAIKFTNAGTVQLNVKLGDSRRKKDTLEFSIQDTGEGIAPEAVNEIFESFYQPKSITTKKYGGSGLGLAIVKRLVELHGGTISVETQVGFGSRFFFAIDLKRGAKFNSSLDQSNEIIQGLDILIAEDNLINAMVVKKLLSNWGINSSHATNGEEVISMANSKQYDIIMMDIHMPEMNGFDAASAIKSNPGPNQDTPIYALTADVTANQKKLYKSVFEGFLLKPIEQQKLYQTLVNRRDDLAVL